MDSLQKLRGTFEELDTSKPIHLHFAGPSARALAFSQAAYDSNVVSTLDISEWVSSERARELSQDRAILLDAPIEEVVKLITSLVRGERFSEGTLDNAINSGLLNALLERYCVLKDYDSHLDVLKTAQKKVWLVQNPFAWSSWLDDRKVFSGLEISIERLPNLKVGRRDVYDFVDNPTSSVLECVIMILAWGGMNRTHAQSALETWEKWQPICDDLQAERLSREAAYDAFISLRQSGMLKGMGPAYFTKLIFFLSPRHDGYIMDQWTARSMNLLQGRPVVIMNKGAKNAAGGRSYVVSDKNSSCVYEYFCTQIEVVAADMGWSSIDTEEAIFSSGRGTGDWRNYVIKNT